MRRHILGILALLLLGFGLSQFVVPSNSAAAGTFLYNSGIRMGLVLGALWLAYAQVNRIGAFIERLPSWLFYAAIVGLFVIVRYPAAALLVVPLLLVLWILKPPAKSKASRPAANRETSDSAASHNEEATRSG